MISEVLDVRAVVIAYLGHLALVLGCQCVSHLGYVCRTMILHFYPVLGQNEGYEAFSLAQTPDSLAHFTHLHA